MNSQELLKNSVNPEYSLLAISAKNNVPIFTPSPGDSSIGMNLAKLKYEKNGIIIDTDLDILESTAIIYNSSKTGAIELGGGAPKNFYMQTQPMLSQILNIDKGGHNYFIQITEMLHIGVGYLELRRLRQYPGVKLSQIN